MKLNVLQTFKDKYTNELYKKGTTIQVTEARSKELLANELEIVSKIKCNKTKRGD